MFSGGYRREEERRKALDRIEERGMSILDSFWS
jgi:hypothetical protein